MPESQKNEISKWEENGKIQEKKIDQMEEIIRTLQHQNNQSEGKKLFLLFIAEYMVHNNYSVQIVSLEAEMRSDLLGL